MQLTSRRRQLLEMLRDGEDCVEEGNEVWVGLERTSVATLTFFLRNCLVTPDECGDESIRHYELTEGGKRALIEPAFDRGVELLKTPQQWLCDARKAREAREAADGK